MIPMWTKEDEDNLERRVRRLHPDVAKAVESHDLGDPFFVHTNLDVMGCACQPASQSFEGGGTCADCGGLTVRTGTCETCTQCGTQGGCG